MDRAKAKIIHQKLNEVMAQFAKENGLTFIAGRATYDTEMFNMKVSLGATASETGILTHQERKAELLPEMAKIYGLSLERNRDGKKLVGYNAKAREYPWIYEGPQGGRWKLGHSQAAIWFKAA